MKKRVLSILLISIMLLSMLPMTALADNGTLAEPELQMHMRVWNNGQEGVHVVTKDFDYPIYHWLEAKFFLHYPDGTNTPLDIMQLGFTSELNCMGVNDGGWIRIQTAAIGPGKVVYETDSATYTVDINVTYPDLGIYTAMPFDASSLTDTVTVDSAGCVFYIALSPEMQARGRVMTEVHSAFGSEIDDPSITTIGTVELSDDGTYAAVTVTNAQAEGSYHFEAEVENSNGDPWGTLGRSVSIENNTPRLYYCYADRNDETKSWKIRFEDPKSTWYTTPGNSKYVAFFFGRKSDIRAGSIEPLPLEDLRFYQDLDADDMEDDEYTVPANILRVECTGFNTKAIRYSTGVEIYYIEVVNTLPEIGFYTASTPSEATYIYKQNPFTVTESDRVFYLLPDDTDNIRNISIVEWYDEDAEDLFDVSVASDGSAVKFIVKDGAIVPDNGVGIEIQYKVKRHSDSWETHRNSVRVWLENGQPTLMFCHLSWDDEEQEFYEPENRRLQTSLDASTGNSFVVQFYYGTKKSMVKVEPEELTFPTDIICGYLRDGALRLDAVGFNESGSITYAGKNGEKASMRVNVSQPSYALYNSTTASKATYLGDEITLGGKDYPEVYLIAASGHTIRQIGEIRNLRTGEDAAGKFKVQLAGDGSYAILQLNENDLPAGNTHYEIRIPDTDYRGGFFYISFMLNRGDLDQLATPTNLVWHKKYSQWYDQEEKKMNLITEDRMGSMGFEIHGLCQNRAQIEIYSSADGYTVPVSEGSWRFGDMEDLTHFSVTDFIYDDLPSGTYKFRVRAKGDGTVYRDSEWSELSAAFVYVRPEQQLVPPAASGLIWRKNEEGHYAAVWPLEAGQQDGAGYFEVSFYHTDENGETWRNGSIFDIHINEHGNLDYDVCIPDVVLEEHGAVDYYFKVRVIPADITQYRISEWSDFSEALDVESISESVNDQLENLLPTDDKKTTVQDVQDALENQTAELRAAMAADLELSDGASNGTLDLIQQLENEVLDNVKQEVDVANNAPQAIQDIASGVTMIGATLNLADANPGTGKTPTVTLEIDVPKKGIAIEEQQHNAVQFSMKLNGAIDKDDKEEGQQLIVPIVIDMPVPEGINPDFLVILHQLWDGTIEQIRPYIYWNEDAACWHARFVIDSFSDFAFVEYNFRFETGSVNKQVGDQPFLIAAVGQAPGSSVVYTSSDPDIASVDETTGEVTVHMAGTVTITASASATVVYPEAKCSYTLTVTEAPAPSEPPVSFPIMQDSTIRNRFADVPADAYFYDAVLWAVENGITYGTSDTTFSPNASCTRAQMVTFLWRAAGSPAPRSMSGFADIPADAYYARAVAWAVENGITGGVGSNKFAPDAVCTRAQMAAFLCRMAGGKAVSSTIAFTDVSADAYYAEAVQWAVENGITDGVGDNKFAPDGICTRAQIVTFLFRFFVK